MCLFVLALGVHRSNMGSPGPVASNCANLANILLDGWWMFMFTALPPDSSAKPKTSTQDLNLGTLVYAASVASHLNHIHSLLPKLWIQTLCQSVGDPDNIPIQLLCLLQRQSACEPQKPMFKFILTKLDPDNYSSHTG